MATNPPDRRPGRPSQWKPLIVCVAAGALCIAVVLGGREILITGPPPPPDDCVPLELNSGTEKGDLLVELAKAYNQSSASTFGDNQCAAVSVHEITSGAARQALADGWDPERVGAPEPQVWTPTSSLWLDVLAQNESAKIQPAVPDGGFASITKSPLVIAMPRPMAEALGWPERQVGWEDILELSSDPEGWGAFDHSEWGQFTLGKDNPHLSTSGMAATVATFYAASGPSSDLTSGSVARPEVRDFVRGVEAGVLHYADDAVKYLANLYEADKRGEALSYVSAVILQEQLLYLYNKGSPTGDPDFGDEPQVPLVALYPEDGTLMMDHPYVVLPSATSDQRAAAADFLAYLQEPEQQERFAELGFRNDEGKAGAELAKTIGMPDGQELSLITPPAPEVLAQILDSWDELRKKANVLLVLDVSESMNKETSTGKTKLELTKQAATKALELLHDSDNLGLWTFSDEGHPEHDGPYAERVPLSRIGDVEAEIVEAINGLDAKGGTALYHTVRKAQQHMLERLDQERINAVVVLSDGGNNYPRLDYDLATLLKDLGVPDLEHSVRIFSIAFGKEADLGALEEIGKATRGAAYDARNPAAIDQVFTSVLSNF